jgi:hypothetical protein
VTVVCPTVRTTPAASVPKLYPVMVAVTPPATGPLRGVTDEIEGANGGLDNFTFIS